MPLLDQNAARSYSTAPTTIAPLEDTPAHSALEVAAAAFRQNNIVTSLYQHLTTQTLPETPQAGYDPLGDLEGYEQQWKRFVNSDSANQSANIKARIDEELRDQRTLHEAGAWGHAASFAAGAVDPATLASMAIPVPGTGTARVARMMATNAVIDTGSEIIQHQFKETRTVGDSLLNVGAGTVLTGVLGSVAELIPPADFNRLRDALQDELHPPTSPINTSGSSVGAAAVGANTTLKQESIAGVGEALAKTVGKVSMLSRVMTSNSKLARQVAQDLAEVPYTLEKNAEGIETPVAVETLAKSRRDAAAYAIVREHQDAYKAYRDSFVAGSTETPLSAAQFGEEVSAAMRRGDTSPVPEAAALAAKLRSSIIDPTTKELQKVGLLRDPVKEAQARLDEDTAHEFVGKETQRLVKDFIARGGDESEALTIKNIRSVQAATEIALQKTPPHLKGLDKVHFEQKVKARGQADLDKIEPHLTTRLLNRAKAVFEGRATDANPGVNELAELLRKRDRNEIVGKLTPQKQTDVTGFDVIGAQSYLPRLYDHRVIKANLNQFHQDIANWYISKNVDRLEADSIATSVERIILGTTRGFTTLGNELATVIKAGPLQGRTLNVPDTVLEPYLVNNSEVVLSRYVHSVLPQLEMQRKFGSLDLKPEIDKISEEYAVLQNAATTDKEKAFLEKQLRHVTEDLAEMRDRVLGKAGIPSDPESMVVRGARLFRDYNYVRLLGSQVFSSIADAGRVVTMHGLARTGKVMARFASDLEFNRLARDEAKRLGVGLDWTLNTRGASFADIGDFSTSRLEDYSKAVTSNFNKITGMATWNSSMKMIAATLQQDKLLALTKAQSLSKNELTDLAALGINEDMLKRIGKQFETHGTNEGLRRGRSDLWTDTEARGVFEAAIAKASDIAVLTKGVGDTPAFMSKEVWKTIFQFKSFGMAAVNRLVIPAAQGLQRGDLAYVSGISVMLGLGVMRYLAKQWTADQPIELTPSTLVREAIDGSGMSSYFMDLYDPTAALLHLPRGSRYTDRNPIETMLGPTVGTATDLYDAAKGISDHGGVKRNDIHRLRKLAPWQNVFYLRRGINVLEDSVAEGVGAQ